ncbi:uncharacterized protein Tco025E_03079 [Trypanosoma conorhini]|uniref:RNA-editing substrate-binding complex 8 protein HEAT repeats domain-containing protein n=1 Tax=Trypanosoma conorhini TaxID=83891 RepID=A0A422PXJ5_9TRYP|nr:uncharacterized protein Tco025E_03079 [Trypanosoma conorhini]RNF22479.1 hypothetical protein Tco025E_03079 [Trypanosoma conorhini]
MRRSAVWLQSGVLSMLIDAVSTRRVELGPEDVYKICALLKAKDDALLLQTNRPFLFGLHAEYLKMGPDAVAPFQRTFIDGVFAAHPVADDVTRAENSAGTAAAAAGRQHRQQSTLALTTTTTTKDTPESALAAENNDNSRSKDAVVRKGAAAIRSDEEPTVEERIAAIWEVVQEYQSTNFVGTDGMQKIHRHCKALELQLRQMKPFEVASLVRALATINYQDYAFTNLIARRSCEVASKLSSSELCRTYFNLSKLQSHDSLVAFVNQIEAQMERFHREQIQFVAMALERQPQIASAPARMVPKLLARAVSHFSEKDSVVYHRALLIVAARYNLSRHPAVVKIIEDASKHLESIPERDLLALLQSTVDLGVPAGTPGLAELLGKAEAVVSTIDIRHVDALMDILSVLPMDTGGVMANLMNRLVADGGKLTMPQLTFILDLLSSYPPAKDNACVSALAFAASLRAEYFDREALEQVVLSLAQLNQFSDDFYALVAVLQGNKGGFRSFDNLASLMKCCSRAVVLDVRGQDMITKGILDLAPTMNDEELAEARRLLTRLGVNDKNVHQMIFRRAKQLQREAGSRWTRRGCTNVSDDFT